MRHQSLLKMAANPSEGRLLEHRWTFHATRVEMRIKKDGAKVR